MKQQRYCMFKGLLTIVLIVSVMNSFGQPEDYSQWAHSKNIIINTGSSGYGIAQDIQNFPYLVRLDKDGFDFSQAKDKGEDIRFANASGAHLRYQIDSWNKSGKVAAIWVKVDRISGNNTTQYIKMHWGKSNASDSSSSRAVFETGNDFAAVWHFSASGRFSDATANGLTLTNNNSTSLQSSVIGEGRSLDGEVSTNLSRSNHQSLNIKNYLTLSAWVKPINVDRDQKVMGKTSNWPPIGYLLGINSRIDPEFWDPSGASHRPSGGLILSGKWSYITATWSTGDKALSYVNGAEVGSIEASSNGLGTNSSEFYIGRPGFSPNGLVYEGDVDEVRVSKTARSADWIRLSYLNQKPGAKAPPTIEFPEKNIFLLWNRPVDIIPTLTGLVDSVTLTPNVLPLGLFFDSNTGSIKGNTRQDFFQDTFYVTAINDKGSDTDTISIYIGPTSIAVDKWHSGSQFIAAKSGDLPRLYFMVAPNQNIREIDLSLFDCKGTLVWSSQLYGSGLEGGIQSAVIDTERRLGMGIYLLEMKMYNIMATESGKTSYQKIVLY